MRGSFCRTVDVQKSSPFITAMSRLSCCFVIRMLTLTCYRNCWCVYKTNIRNFKCWHRCNWDSTFFSQWSFKFWLLCGRCNNLSIMGYNSFIPQIIPSQSDLFCNSSTNIKKKCLWESHLRRNLGTAGLGSF